MERSQGHVSLIRRSGWPTFRLIFAVLLLLWPAAAQRTRPSSVAVQPPGTDDLAGTLRQNVVRIQAQRQAGTENGFGFIVGERGGNLYIVTAYHVVNDSDQVGESKSNVKVTFYGDQGNSYSAQVLATHELPPHDLAVLMVPTPAGFRWIRKCLATAKPTRGTSVWSIARGEEWLVQGRPGAVASDRPSADQIIQLDEMKVMRGSSGGPAVSSDGIIGMILTDSAENTRALTIDFIKDAFADWNHPWNLEPSQLQISGGGEVQSRGGGAAAGAHLREKEEYSDLLGPWARSGAAARAHIGEKEEEKQRKGAIVGGQAKVPVPIVRRVAIMNANSGLCLSPAGGTGDLNNPIVQFTCDQDPSRFWSFTVVNDDIVQIRNLRNNLCLTIAGGSTELNQGAVQYTCDSDPSRRWRYTTVDATTFRLVNVHSNLCLTIAGGGNDRNTQAIQYRCDGDPSRNWKLRR